jgi:hypothetical protein
MFAAEKKACNLFLFFAFVLVKGKTYVDRKREIHIKKITGG